MGDRYVAFNLEAFTALMTDMGFARVTSDKERELQTFEAVFERQVEAKAKDQNLTLPVIVHDEHSFLQFPFKVRIWSSIDKRSGVTRDSGEDAIRIDLVSLETLCHHGCLSTEDGLHEYCNPKCHTGHPVKAVTAKCLRTVNAFETVRKTCREMFKFVANNTCPACHTGVMVKRKTKDGSREFRGCSRFPECVAIGKV